MSEKEHALLKEKLKLLPQRPGVYLMKDRRGKIFTWAKLLIQQRVRSIFSLGEKLCLK